MDALSLAGNRRLYPTASDAVEVGNLMQAYALYTDSGRRAELAALFTPDSTWNGTELGYGSAAGPDDIVAAVLAHYDPQRPMVHLPGPPMLVKIAEDRIEAFSWCLATRQVDGAMKPLIYFSYEDVLARTNAGWLFESRVLRLRLRS